MVLRRRGVLAFWVGGRIITAPWSSFVYGRRDVPHPFLVSCKQARCLIVVEPSGFESFIRELGTAAQELVIPPPALEPPDIARFTALAGQGSHVQFLMVNRGTFEPEGFGDTWCCEDTQFDDRPHTRFVRRR